MPTQEEKRRGAPAASARGTARTISKHSAVSFHSHTTEGVAASDDGSSEGGAGGDGAEGDALNATFRSSRGGGSGSGSGRMGLEEGLGSFGMRSTHSAGSAGSGPLPYGEPLSILRAGSLAVSLHCLLAALAAIHTSSVPLARVHQDLTRLHLELQAMRDKAADAHRALQECIDEINLKRTTSK